MLNKVNGERSNNQSGFTLIELLFAVTIFAVGILAVATMQLSAIRGNKLSSEWSRATELARMQIEALKTGDLTTASYNDGTHGLLTMNEQGNTGEPNAIYNVGWQVESNTTFSKRIIVTASWTRAGLNHSVSLRTITKGGGI